MSGSPAWTLEEALEKVAACPVCHGKLSLPSYRGIRCQTCGGFFEIRDGIPIMNTDPLPKALQEEVDWYAPLDHLDKVGARSPAPDLHSSAHLFAHAKARYAIEETLRRLGCNESLVVLSLACGVGEEIPLIEVVTRKIVGIDLALNGLCLFRKKFSYPVFLGNAGKMPFQDEAFDFVVISGLLHHIVGYDELVPYLKEVGRVLKKGGWTVAVEPNSLYPVQWLIGPCNRLMQCLRPGWRGLVSHERPLSPKFIMRQFLRAGFRNVDYESTTFTHNRMPLALSQRTASIERLFIRMPVVRMFGWWTVVTACREKDWN